MTTRRPARAHAQKAGVVDVPDKHRARKDSRSLVLGMATQTQVRIALDQQFGVDGAMRSMAGRATFPHGRMLENKRSRLGSVALRTIFVQPRHGQAARRLEYVAAVWIVAFRTTDFLLGQWMVLRQMKLCFGGTMALKARRWILARIHNVPATSSAADMQTPGAVTGFATGLACGSRILQPDSRVGARGKNAADIRVTFGAGFIADECCSRYVRRRR